MAAPNIQAQKAFTAAIFKNYMKISMKCSDQVVKALNDTQGVTVMLDFEDLHDSEWNAILKALLTIPKTIKVRSGRGHREVDTRGHILTALSLRRLKCDSKSVRSWKEVGYPVTFKNVQWKIIEEIYEVLTDLKEKSNGKASVELSKLKKDTDLPLWLEFNFPELYSIVGARGIPFYYLIRKKDVSVNPGPDLLAD